LFLEVGCQRKLPLRLSLPRERKNASSFVQAPCSEGFALLEAVIARYARKGGVANCGE